MANESTGYSLIELVVLIAIISIMAMAAVPMYDQYIQSSKVAASLKLIDPYKARLIEYYGAHGAFPESASEIFPQVDSTWTSGSGAGGKMNISDENVASLEYVAYLSGSPNRAVALGINYKDSTGLGTNPTLYFVVYVNNNRIEMACGNWSPGHTQNINPDAMPNACTATSISTY